MKKTHTIFGILRPHFRPLLTLDNLTRPRELDIFLRLSLQELFRSFLQIFFTTILRKYRHLVCVFQFFFLLLVLMVEKLTLSRVGVYMNVITSSGSIPCKELEFGYVGGFTGVSEEVITCEDRLVNRQSVRMSNMK